MNIHNLNFEGTEPAMTSAQIRAQLMVEQGLCNPFTAGYAVSQYETEPDQEIQSASNPHSNAHLKPRIRADLTDRDFIPQDPVDIHEHQPPQHSAELLNEMRKIRELGKTGIVSSYRSSTEIAALTTKRRNNDGTNPNTKRNRR